MNETFAGSALQRGWYPESAIRAIGHTANASGHNLPYNYRQMVLLGAYLHKRFHGTVYARSQNLRATIQQAYDAALQDVDLLVLPTMRALPPEFKVGKTYKERVDLTVFGGEGINLAEFVGNVAAFSYTGHPAITVPCGELHGLPVGGQIVGRFFEDQLVLRAAQVAQEAC